ncbi:MAG: sulfatase-like hydrolase/transferase [Deltaproteobacteria bacterium]|nr:sulfatase-like hydrolase/transferase [Deltaproteobacteria bacterium]
MQKAFRHLAKAISARWWPVSGERRSALTALLVATPLVLVLLAAAETTHLPGYVFTLVPGQALLVFLHGLAATAWYLCPSWLVGFALALLLRATEHRDLRPLLFAAACTALVAPAVVWSSLVLVRYRPFVGHVPFIAMHVWTLILAAASAFTLRVGTEPRRPVAMWLLRLAPDLALVSAVVLYGWGYANQRGQYPTLHLSLLLNATLLGALGLANVFSRGTMTLPTRAKGLAAVALLLALPFAGALVVRLSPSAARAETMAAHYTDVGIARMVFARAERHGVRAAVAPGPADKSDVSLFLASSALPRLPSGFKLTDYNVLLVMSEAVRFDRTSLADPMLGTTPHLSDFAKSRDAFSFPRAYTPSSNTLEALAGLFTMTWPSLAPLEVWEKSWDGKLLESAKTVAELFAAAGYDTFQVTHDRSGCFSRWMRGLEQGFDRVERVEEKARSGAQSPELVDAATTDRPTDEKIVDLVTQEIDYLKDGDRRFFGWVFFVSPHAEYLAHFRDMPADTEEQRYMQEVRYMDSQLGRLLEALDKSGEADRTIVIVTADHGEEFGEHGGRTHASTVYEEQIHVPLGVRIPGLRGSIVRRPTSSLYVFPWLLLRGDFGMRAAAQDRLRSDIAPMLRATGGAVVSELLGHMRMSTALVEDDRKLIHDFYSGFDELYELKADPGESLNLLLLDPEGYTAERGLIESYENARAAREAFALKGPRGRPMGSRRSRP